MKNIRPLVIFVFTAILVLAGARAHCQGFQEEHDSSDLSGEAELGNIATESQRHIESVRQEAIEKAAARKEARQEQRSRRKAAPKHEAKEAVSSDEQAPSQPKSQAKRAPKFAVVYVSPNLNAKDMESFHPAIEREEEYLRRAGYQVIEKPFTDRTFIDDLWSGIKAASFFGHGGASGPKGANTPTFGGFDADEWRSKVRMDRLDRLGRLGHISPDQEANLIDKPAQNLGLELVRNYSCSSFADTSLAHRFVKPGGLYYGAQTALVMGSGVEQIPRCVRGAVCACLWDSTSELTKYRVPGLEEVNDPDIPLTPPITPITPPRSETSGEAGPPDCKKLNPEGKSLEKGQFYAALDRYNECLKGGTALEQCVRCVNKLIQGPCYVREATLAGWGLCLTCSPDGGVAPENRFIEKNRCPVCQGLSYTLSDFNPAPDNCVPHCSKASDSGRRKSGPSTSSVPSTAVDR